MIDDKEIIKRLKLIQIQAFAEFSGVSANSLYKMRSSDSLEGFTLATVKKVSDALVKIGEAK